MKSECSAGVLIELRKSRRYRVAAPVFFLWEGPGGLLQEAKGTVRDISDRGIFLAADVAPRSGAHLDVDVHLPSPRMGAGSVQLHGEGTVVRLDCEAESVKGFAASVTFQAEAASGPSLVAAKLQ